jgi:hypothetical protein
MARWIGAAIFIASIGFVSAAQDQKKQIPDGDDKVNLWILIEQVRALQEVEAAWQDLPEDVRKPCSEARTSYEKLQRCMDALTKH